MASDNTPLVSDISKRLAADIAEFDSRYIAADFDPFAKLEWPSDKKEQENIWKPISQMLASGPRNPSEIDEIKRSLVGEHQARDQTIVSRNFDQLERRLVSLHSALIEAIQNSDSLDGELKKSAIKLLFRSYLTIYQVGLVLSPILAEKNYYFWHGILFYNDDPEALQQVKDKERRVLLVMSAIRAAVLEKGATQIGSKKLGEVFKALAGC